MMNRTKNFNSHHVWRFMIYKHNKIRKERFTCLNIVYKFLLKCMLFKYLVQFTHLIYIIWINWLIFAKKNSHKKIYYSNKSHIQFGVVLESKNRYYDNTLDKSNKLCLIWSVKIDIVRQNLSSKNILWKYNICFNFLINECIFPI